jgi:tetratricopeptide (TPR) repeat protein
LADEACRLHDEALAAQAAGRVKRASRLARAGYARMVRAVGPRHPDVANILLACANAERDLGHMRSAEALGRRAMAVANSFARLRMPEIARIRVQAMVTLASVLVATGEWPEARALYAVAGRTATRRLGPRAPDLAAVMVARGVLCKFEGDLSRAARLYASALRILRAGRDADAEATLLHNLAGLEHARGHHARAERLAIRGLALRERTVGHAHPSYAGDLAGYAAILVGKRRWADSKRVGTRAIRIFERTLGPRSPEIAHALANLAAAHEATGDLPLAVEHYERSLAIALRSIGGSNVDVAATLASLSELAERRGDSRSASRYRRRAERLMRRFPRRWGARP